MRTFLLGVESVHSGAALCDYLDTRAREEFDVWVVSLGNTSDRDLGDIKNVLMARLAGGGEIHTEHRNGDRGAVIPTVADEVGADEIILTIENGTTSLEDAISAVVANIDRPIVLVPVNEPA